MPEANSQHVSWESFKTAVGVEPVAQEAPAEVPETSVEDPTQFKDDPVERQQLAHIMRQECNYAPCLVLLLFSQL